MARFYSLKAGEEIPEAILKMATKERIRTAEVKAIGGVDRLRLAYFNHESKKYEEHEMEEFMEVAGLLGNLTLKEGKPFLHLHGTFGRRDMSAISGHVVYARIMPLLEATITPTRNRALRKFDEETGLNLVYRVS